jgi:formylglycine-generating enzyme required for sulfatase activity
MISALWSQFEGQSIDNSFRLTRLIGVGGFGAVFLADHVVEARFVRRVAVKLLESQPESFERQFAELITATTLQHPHLLRCFHAGSVTFGQAKLLYLVMEIAEESLEARIEKAVLRFQEAIILTQDLASALAFLHQQKRIHRDLKPGNVLRVGETWKLADFGTVRQSAGIGISQTTGFTGTIAYMPPESFDGIVSPAWDMWSLGVLVLEALTGRTPYRDATGHEMMRAILTEAPTIPPDLPRPFGEIVRGCLIKDSRERWSAQRVIESLTRHWHDEAAERTVASRPAPRQPAPPTVAERRSSPVVVPPPPGPVVKRRNLAWVVILAAIVVITASVWVVLSGGKHATEATKSPPSTPTSTGPTRVNPKDGLTYLWIPPGTFVMGCSPGDGECWPEEGPAHEVTITKGVWIGQTLVTQNTYQRIAGTNPSVSKGANLPVTNVNWNEALGYCQTVGMRLPTEAEWEYAARAGSTQSRYGNLDQIAWYKDNSGDRIHEVGQKQSNAWGLYDMLGDAEQWTGDWFDENYYNRRENRDPMGPPTGLYRVLRGGGYFWSARYARASTRQHSVPVWAVGTEKYQKDVGFRCAGD